MIRSLRILLCVVFSIIILLGIGLSFVSRLDPVVQSYDSQKSVCRFAYAIQLNPAQAQSNNCVVLANDWLQLSVKSNLNVSLSISLVKVTGGEVTLFNNTNTNLNASFPLSYSGAIVAQLRNTANNVSEVNGSLSVMSLVLDNTTSLNTVEPYRTIGEVLIGVGALGAFLVVWNPPLSGAPVSLPVPRREGLSS
jgi:hypothetical protein